MWDLVGPKPKRRFEYEDDGLNSTLAFLPGRDRLFCGAILDVANSPPKVVGTMGPAKGGIDKIHQSDNSTEAVLETDSGISKYVRIWETGSKPKALGPVQFPTYFGDQPILAVRGDKWAVASGRLLRVGRLEGGSFRTPDPRDHYAPVTALAIDRRSRVASAARDSTIRLWRAPGANSKGSVVINNWADRLALSPDGSLLAATGPALRVWDVRAEEPAVIFERANPEGDARAALAFAPDGKALAVTERVSKKGPLLVPEYHRSEVVTFDPLHFSKAPARFDVVTDDFWAVSLSRTGRALVCGKNGVEVWPHPTRRKRKLHALGLYSMEAVAVSGDGSRTAVGGEEGYGDRLVLLYDTSGSRPRELADYDKHRAPLVALALTPDGKKLASSDESGKVCVWDPDRPDPVHEWTFPGTVLSLAFSHDGRYLLTGNDNGTIYVLRLKGDRR